MHPRGLDPGPTGPTLVLFTRHMPKQLHPSCTTCSANPQCDRLDLLSIVRSSSSFCIRAIDSWLTWYLTIRGYTPSPDLTNALFTTTFACASVAPGLATLTNIWSAPHGDSRTDTVWPITVPTGAVTPTAVLNKPTVSAMAIPIMWESTDSEVVSWFNNYQSSSSPAITTSLLSHSTTTSTPFTTSTVLSSANSTTTKSSGATSLGTGARLMSAVLGAVVLIYCFNL